MNPRVKSVIPTDEYSLILTFTNGEPGIYDCSKLSISRNPHPYINWTSNLSVPHIASMTIRASS